MNAQNAHPETKQPGVPYRDMGGPYRDMGGRFENTCLVHAKSVGGVIGKLGWAF